MKFFRYSDRSGVHASFPMFRSKKFPTFRSMQLVAFRLVFRYSDRSGTQASFPVFRPMFDNQVSSDAQIEVISSIQIDERHSGHGYFCVTIYFGIQANIPCFRVQTDSHRTRQILFQDHLFADSDMHYYFIFHFSVNFRAFIVFNPLIPWKCESRCYLPFRSPFDWIGAAVIPQNLPYIFFLEAWDYVLHFISIILGHTYCILY